MTQAVTASYPQFAINYVTHALSGCMLFELFDEALADLLGLVTFRHGTAPANMYSILWTGASTRFGGKSEGNAVQEDTGRFYVVRDRNQGNGDCCDCIPCLGSCDKELDNYMSLGHTARSYARATTSKSDWQYTMCDSIPVVSFSPTLKFRFRPDQIAKPNDIYEGERQVFYDDRTEGGAEFTWQPITPDHTGFYATLAQGLDTNIWQRAQADPARFTRGLYKLSWAVLLAAFLVLGIIASPVTCAMISAYLIWEAAVCIGCLVVPALSHWYAPPIPPQDVL